MAKIGNYFVNLLSLHFVINKFKVKAAIIFVSCYQCVWTCMSMTWWLYPYLQAYLNKPCSKAFFILRNIAIFFYCMMPFIQGITLSYVIRLVAMEKEPRSDSVDFEGLIGGDTKRSHVTSNPYSDQSINTGLRMSKNYRMTTETNDRSGFAFDDSYDGLAMMQHHLQNDISRVLAHK